MATTVVSKEDWIPFFEAAGFSPLEADHFAAIFFEQKIRESLLPELTLDFLKEMGIGPFGDRLIILKRCQVGLGTKNGNSPAAAAASVFVGEDRTTDCGSAPSAADQATVLVKTEVTQVNQLQTEIPAVQSLATCADFVEEEVKKEEQLDEVPEEVVTIDDGHLKNSVGTDYLRITDGSSHVVPHELGAVAKEDRHIRSSAEDVSGQSILETATSQVASGPSNDGISRTKSSSGHRKAEAIRLGDDTSNADSSSELWPENPFNIQAGQLVWAKLPEFPWWPARVFRLYPLKDSPLPQNASVAFIELTAAQCKAIQHGLVNVTTDVEPFISSFADRYNRKRTNSDYQKCCAKAISLSLTTGEDITPDAYFMPLISKTCLRHLEAYVGNNLSGDTLDDKSSSSHSKAEANSLSDETFNAKNSSTEIWPENPFHIQAGQLVWSKLPPPQGAWWPARVFQIYSLKDSPLPQNACVTFIVSGKTIQHGLVNVTTDVEPFVLSFANRYNPTRTNSDYQKCCAKAISLSLITGEDIKPDAHAFRRISKICLRHLEVYLGNNLAAATTGIDSCAFVKAIVGLKRKRTAQSRAGKRIKRKTGQASAVDGENTEQQLDLSAVVFNRASASTSVASTSSGIGAMPIRAGYAPANANEGPSTSTAPQNGAGGMNRDHPLNKSSSAKGDRPGNR